VHPAEDSDDKECGSVPKMINDLLLSEEKKHTSIAVFHYTTGKYDVILEYFNRLSYFF